ncbi:LacI family DNA-binding transcriptional regulator [Acholeplasma granularum]|uniref:LacI family DNA-binding transcriptional regulator n=1 Tax=Acholeplasma granularum TaxID=264635 RepID=UPI000470FFD3|nr:LacI family DNA-binding transcriptional regulator [Acholeplasma granularum]
MQKRVLLKDIAEKMGLTINTVSRALKDKKDISEDTKTEVRRIAYQMGYIPDTIASSLRSGVTKTIGVMFDNIANPYFVIMTDLLHQELKKDGYEMMIYTNSGDHAQLDVDNFNLMASRRLDGIITFLKPTEDVVRLANNNSVPMVILGREGEDINVDSVYTDDYLGGQLMAQYLSAKYLDKVAYVGAPIDIMCSIKRSEGLMDYYHDLNHPIKNEYIIYIEHYIRDFHKHIDFLVEEDIKAIFCFNDSMAYDAMSYLKKHYPYKNIEVTGYDNIGYGLRIPVDLTTIDSDKVSMVKKVVRFIKNRIQDPNMPIQTKVYQTKLVKFE